MLKAKKMFLNLIVIQDGTSSTGIMVWGGGQSLPQTQSQWRCQIAPELVTVCHRLILRNHAIVDMAAGMCWIFHESALGYEEKWMHLMVYTKERRHLTIAIPQLTFHSTDSSAEMLRRLLMAAEEHCPPVSTADYDKAQRAYQRWADTLINPEQWTFARHWLNLYNGFGIDGSVKSCKDVDWKTLDISSLNKLAVQSLAVFCKT
ncbi:uncharacterized protein LOC129591456 [Paramacrobiotus metropolitanus]|uniref:uncharacterized protein LOC129591456 n=1 Tax=Paramacrobiotus metropolitanus TaxID=2943436 RepID=UPI0024465A78|nr:uncharacterized protein LOC129591456 [Paramacrobiotus metropolitanus]